MTVLNTLLEITIYSAALFGVIWLFRLLLKKHLSAAFLYMAWFLLIARLIMPVTITTGFSFFIMPSAQTAVQAQSADLTSLLEGLDNTVVPERDAQAQTNNVVQQSETLVKQAADAEAETYAIPAANVPLKITWKTALISLWLAGMAVMLIQMSVSAIRLKKRLKNAKSIPPEWQRIADDLKNEMGLRRSIRVVMIEGFPSPALSTGIKPVVILPEELLEKSSESVRFALLHEMTHIRRGDHIMSLLLLLLRAVYWFNPVVWLMAKYMRLDMETACDSSLVRPMSKQEKKRYAGTMLSMYAAQQVRYVLGMALGQTKKTAERRLRGVFMRSKSSRKAHAAALILAIVMLVTCFTTACQPTPEEPVIVGKNQEKMLEAAAQTPEKDEVVPPAEQVNALDTYSADISLADGKLTITANAPVFIPDMDGMPTIRVQAADFTQEQVDGMITALFEGQTIYETEWGPETKDEIMEQIVRCEQMKTTEEYSSEGDQEQMDERIAMLKRNYEKAPEKSEDIITESDGQLKQMEVKDQEYNHMAYYMGLNVTTNTEDYEQGESLMVQNNDDMTEAVFEIRKDDDGNVTGMSGRPLRRNAMMRYNNYAIGGWTNWGQHPPIAVNENTVIDDPAVMEKLKMTPAQAKAQVEALLNKAGIDYMQVCAMYLLDDENLGNYDGIVSPAENYAYRVCCCRTLDGVPCAYLRGYSSVGGMDESIKGNMDVSSLKYVGDWEYETFQIMLNDQGIISLSWSSPLNIQKTLVENSALLPFERIVKAFEQRIRDKYEPQAREEHVASIEFKVERVSLELQRIAEQDSLETGLLVPVWNFYGTEMEGFVDREQDDVHINYNGFNEPRPILSVNAIDASVIDNDIGY